MGKKALITGITGQDGSYLAEFLLKKGYEVYGMHRRSSVDGHFERIEDLIGKINLIQGDLADAASLDKCIEKVKPDEIYNLGAQSQVGVSFLEPYITKEVNWFGVQRLIDSMKQHSPHFKFYQASTSELFGEVTETPQNENTPFNPISPYSKAKLEAHKFIRDQREKERLFACNGILFNHESPKRGIEFVTRKITDGLVRVKLGLPQRVTGKDYLEVGNLNAKRDWGFAGDYVEAMWRILQHDSPDDFVIATGESHTVREFIETASDYLEIDIKWEGKDKEEKGYNKEGKKIIQINPEYFRPAEVQMLLGDSSKARKELKWKPKTSFEGLVEMMVKSDQDKLSKN
jgi:GDPmannose 4,6-dehydratase